MDDVPGEVGFVLIDLGDVDLAGLETLDNPVLVGTLQEIRDELEHPNESVVGFTSSV